MHKASNAAEASCHYQVERLVMEATGRYEFNLAQAAYEKGIPVCIVKPLSVRRYAGAIDQLAKTDKIDAVLIAEFAAIVQPRAPPKKQKPDCHQRSDCQKTSSAHGATHPGAQPASASWARPLRYPAVVLSEHWMPRLPAWKNGWPNTLKIRPSGP